MLILVVEKYAESNKRERAWANFCPPWVSINNFWSRTKPNRYFHMISNTCKTAIKAVIHIASKEESGARTGVKEIAKYINASEHTVSKILQNLVRQNIINSVKGPNGGFYITEKQRRQPILAIVNTIDGKDLFNACGLGLNECSPERPCPIHHDYKKGKDIIKELFSTKTIKDVCVPVESGLAYLIG